MNLPIVQSTHGVTLAGGGPFTARDLRLALARAPVPVAADSGADRLLHLGVAPQAVIGDMDSISARARAEIPVERQHLVAEQVTTDFDKALRLIEAPLVLALGFAGARLDHGLAALSTLIARSERRCILIGPQDLAGSGPRAGRALVAVSDGAGDGAQRRAGMADHGPEIRPRRDDRHLEPGGPAAGGAGVRPAGHAGRPAAPQARRGDQGSSGNRLICGSRALAFAVKRSRWMM
jgi:hypothetical protein